MTEDDARHWLADRFDRVVTDRLARFVDFVVEEARHQNLISAASVDRIWARHIVDSAQLMTLALPFGRGTGAWIDIGTGAGFPGMVVAILGDRPTILVEPRRRRADFLDRAAGMLQLHGHVVVRSMKIEAIADRASVITARAVASLDGLFRIAAHCAGPTTQWMLPRGKSALEEVEQARRSWHGTFHVEQSVTDPHSMIVVASGISSR